MLVTIYSGQTSNCFENVIHGPAISENVKHLWINMECLPFSVMSRYMTGELCFIAEPSRNGKLKHTPSGCFYWSLVHGDICNLKKKKFISKQMYLFITHGVQQKVNEN